MPFCVFPQWLNLRDFFYCCEVNICISARNKLLPSNRFYLKNSCKNGREKGFMSIIAIKILNESVNGVFSSQHIFCLFIELLHTLTNIYTKN